jgi:hypothetical protein
MGVIVLGFLVRGQSCTSLVLLVPIKVVELIMLESPLAFNCVLDSSLIVIILSQWS